MPAGLRQIEAGYRLFDLAALECALAGRAMSLSSPLRQDDQALRACGPGVRTAESRGSIRAAPHSGRQALARGEDAEHVLDRRASRAAEAQSSPRRRLPRARLSRSRPPRLGRPPGPACDRLRRA